jgi:hypothetical protein
MAVLYRVVEGTPPMTRPAEPNPGSPEAVEHGCTCPVIDNHYGRGMPYPDGARFWISGDCLLHGATTVDELRERIAQTMARSTPREGEE